MRVINRLICLVICIDILVICLKGCNMSKRDGREVVYEIRRDGSIFPKLK